MKRLAIAAVALAFSTAVWAATATGTAAVTIQNQAITLTNNQGLDFGTVMPWGRMGWVAIEASGTSSVNNVTVVDSSTVTVSTWSVTGTPSAYFGVVVPANGTVLVSDGSGNSMPVNQFGSSLVSGQGVLDGNGNASFNVGASLGINPNQPAGTYSGTFDVTVAYN